MLPATYSNSRICTTKVTLGASQAAHKIFENCLTGSRIRCDLVCFTLVFFLLWE
jgi:hypothetical protein